MHREEREKSKKGKHRGYLRVAKDEETNKEDYVTE